MQSIDERSVAPTSGTDQTEDGVEKTIDEPSLQPGAPGDPCAPAEQTSIQITPSSISVAHYIGTSPCPQPVGSVTLTNTGTTTVTWEAAPGEGLVFSPASGTLAPGARAQVDVRYTDCDAARAIDRSVSIVALQQGGAGTAAVAVHVAVEMYESAVRLDAPLGPFAAGSDIALRRITGGHVAGPDACPAEHLHATSSSGILIDGQGPFTDPNPAVCGYGRIVQIRVQ